MNSEEQAFSVSARRFLDEVWPFNKRQGVVKSAEGFSRDQWVAFAQLGWLSLSLPGEYGGLELDAKYLYLLMEQFGRALVNSPYVPTIVIGSTAIARAGNDQMKREFLPQIVAGQMLIAFANEEPENGRDPLRIATTAKSIGESFVLNGRKSAVQFAHVADKILVSTRLTDAANNRDGTTLFLVDRQAAGLDLKTFTTHDGARASEITLNDVRVEHADLIGEAGASEDLLEALIYRAAAALSVDAMGAMWAVYDLTLDYLKTREQFGVKLGSYQVLQHRMVDIFIKCEMARSLALNAVEQLDEADPAEARRRISAAKYRIGADVTEITKEGIQLHGGVGVTNEYAIGHYLKRAVVFNRIYGDPAWHLARYQTSIG